MGGGGWRRVAFGATVALLGMAAWLFRARPGSPSPPPPAPAPGRAPRAPPRALPLPPLFAGWKAPAPRPPGPEVPRPAAPPAPPAVKPVGDLLLRVVAAESGEPLPDATVVGQSWEGDGPGGGGWEEEPREGDPPGRIRIRGCSVGRHEVRVTAPGRAPGTLAAVVVEGVETAPPDLPLEKEARVRCVVRDAAGRPRAGVEVEVETKFFGRSLARATTDAEGIVDLGGLPSGVLLLSDRRQGPDTLAFVVTAGGSTAEVLLGGVPQVVATVQGQESPRSLVAVPLLPGFDPLGIAEEDESGVPDGTRLLPEVEDGGGRKEDTPPVPEEGEVGDPRGEEGTAAPRYHLAGVRPGPWLLIPESRPCGVVVDVPPEGSPPAWVTLRTSQVPVLLVRGDGSASGLLRIVALREGEAEAALAGDAAALLRLVAGELDRRSVSMTAPRAEKRITVPGDGPARILFGGGGLAGEAAIPDPAGREVGPPIDVVLLPATRVLLRSRAAMEEGGKEARDRWRREKHLLAALDASGRVRALMVGDGDVDIFLPAGTWRLEMRGPRGTSRGADVEVPASGETPFVVD